MRKLTLDIETSPNVVVTWGLWKQDIHLNQILQHQDVLCWAAKWHDSDEVIFRSPFHDGREKMVYEAWNLLDEADVLIHYNGKQFDIPRLNSLFLDAEYLPPSPFNQVDLLTVVKGKFGYASNKLEFIARKLGLGGKQETGGMETWIGCMNNDPAAWDKMREYNIHDVVLTEQLYDRLLPWIDNHLSYGALLGEDVCPNCGSDYLVKNGHSFLKTGVYQRYTCNNCGKPVRGTKRVNATAIVEAT